MESLSWVCKKCLSKQPQTKDGERRSLNCIKCDSWGLMERMTDGKLVFELQDRLNENNLDPQEPLYLVYNDDCTPRVRQFNTELELKDFALKLLMDDPDNAGTYVWFAFKGELVLGSIN